MYIYGSGTVLGLALAVLAGHFSIFAPANEIRWMRANELATNKSCALSQSAITGFGAFHSASSAHWLARPVRSLLTATGDRDQSWQPSQTARSAIRRFVSTASERTQSSLVDSCFRSHKFQ